MHRIYILFTFLILAIPSLAQIGGSHNVGSGETYTTLSGSGGIFAAINSGGLSGNVTINITSDITETGIYQLDQWAESGGSGYTLTIQPDGTTLRTLSSTSTNIYLNGADRVTINGGAGKYLTFKNTSTSGAVFWIEDGAIDNTITNCNIESDIQSFSSGFPGNGAILIYASGSDNDNAVTISNCNISSSAVSVPMGCGIFIYSSHEDNTNTVTVSNNNIYNFAATTASNWACGIYLRDDGLITSTSTASAISDNSFYCNLSTNPTSNQISININGGDAHTISGNYIGGQAAECGGSAWNHAGTSTNFMGMYISDLSNVAVHAQIENNTISNISASNFFYGIYSDKSNIDVDGNTIGHASTTNSINMTGNDGYFYGITDINSTTSTFANTITDNIIANVIHTAEFPGHTYGISLNTVANVDVKRNKIYGIGPQNNTTYYTEVYGVSIANPSGTATLTLVNNVISLGGSTETKSDWFSIYDESFSGLTINLIYNSLYLSGTSNDDANSIAECVARDGTSTFYSKNNLFYNSRSDDASDEIYFFAYTSGITSDNNIFYVPGGDVANYGGTSYTTLANWQTASSKDGNSASQDPNYTSPAGNPADLSITSSNNAGIHFAGYTTDINGTTRDATAPDAGAYEFGAVNWTGNTDNDWSNTGNWSTSSVPTSSDITYIPGSLTNYPNITTGTYGCYSLSLDGTASFTVSGGTFNCANEVYMNNSSNILTVSGGTFTSSGNFMGANSSYAKGTITFSGGTVDLNGGWFVIDATDGSLSISGADVKFGGTDIYVNSDDFTMTSGSLTFDGTASQNLQDMGGSSTYTLTDVSIENTANDVNIIGSLTANGTLDIDPSALLFINADLTVNSGKTVNINADGALSVNSTLTNNGTLTINSTSETASGSLIVSGTATGNVTYNRWMTKDKWHIVSSPVETQTINGVLTDGSGTNSIALSGSDYGVTHYLEGTNEWGTYYTSSTPNNFTSGVGYLMRRQTADGTVSFTGTVADADFTVSLDSTDHAWNALGNPFTSALKANNANGADNLITVNTGVLDESFVALYIWDEQASYTYPRNDYKVINHSGDAMAGGEAALSQDHIQTGQGFIVKAKTNGASFSFTRAMQSHQTTVPFKSGEINDWADINIIVENIKDTISTKTKLKFNSQMTNGLDVGYDAGIFKSNPGFSLFTQLAEDNGVEFMLQCLPTQNLETLEIPIGLDATTGGEISFSIEKNNFTESIIPVLNDKLLETKFAFTADGDVYNITVNDNTKGFGRFTLTFASTTDAENIANVKQHFKAWFSNGKINLYGETTGTEIVRIYTISGQEISNTRLENTNLNTIELPIRISGIYLIRIEKTNGTEVLKVPVIFN